MSISLLIKDINNFEYTVTDILSFTVVKDYYIAYTTLYVKAVYPYEYKPLKSVQLIIDDTAVHFGLLEKYEITVENGISYINIRSKSYTFLLCQNQLEPGMHYKVSLNSLIDSFYTIPNINHENISEELNYIYAKDGSSMWESVINYGYKYNRFCPYIRESNTVMVSLPASPLIVSKDTSQIISAGYVSNYAGIISDYHMQDINGDYNVYQSYNSDAYARDLIRHKQISLDYEYLYDPIQAIYQRLEYSMRGFYGIYVSYEGYSGEDICDKITAGNFIDDRYISRIEINGNSGGITTKVFSYFDRYCNAE